MSSTTTIQAFTPASPATSSASGFAGKFRYVNKNKKLVTNPNLYHMPPLSGFNDPVTLPVRDIRPSLAQGDASSFKLASHGFTARHEPSELHWRPNRLLRPRIKLLKYGVRWEELKLHYGNGDDAETGIPRFALFSVWRSLKTVRRDPLAVPLVREISHLRLRRRRPRPAQRPVHSSSPVSDHRPGQPASRGAVYYEADEEAPTHLSNSYLAYEPSGGNSHDWHFISNQEPEDVLIIQLFDNEMEALEAAKQENKSEPSVGGVIHSAFELQGQDDSAEARESLEVGVVATCGLCIFVVYYWCGQWVASPSLGSAGPLIKRIAYGVGIIGLAVSACLYVHIAAKYLFVRFLRNSRHLQEDTAVHWATWLGCTVGISICSFLIASGIPIFNYILALAGSFCFSPVAICLPGWLWCHDHGHYRRGNVWQITTYYLRVLMIAFGLFMTIGGTYTVIQEIIDAYASGTIGSAFSCADNSGTVV
ncbi:hypothetical protein LQW54_007486 [Pestalotiopsis sp. IQ-011]